MTYSTRSYADDTEITQSFPWGMIVTARALCPDGRVRRVKRISSTADTFFSIPAAVSFKGRTVAGYVTVETRSGSSVETDDDPAVLKFVPYSYGANGHLFKA